MSQHFKGTFFGLLLLSSLLLLLMVYFEKEGGFPLSFSYYFSELHAKDKRVSECLEALFVHENVIKNKTNVTLSQSRENLSFCKGVDVTSLFVKIATLQPHVKEYLYNGSLIDAGFNVTEYFRKSALYNYPKYSVLDNPILSKCKKLLDLSSAMETSDNHITSYMKMIESCEGTKAKLLSTFESRPASNATFKVPNIVHYIMFGEFKFQYLTYLSFLSVETHIKPEYIIIHGEAIPNGIWWTKTRKDVKNIMFLQRKPPKTIFGTKIAKIQHAADIARYEIIYKYGGIYFDADVLALKSFDNLRNYDLTLGRETSYSLANGIIIAKRHSPFIQLWLETYHSFNPSEWGTHSVEMTHRLAKIYPHLVHIEEKSLMRPSWNEPKLMFKKSYDWSKNYAMHIWKGQGKVPSNPMGIQKLKCTLGEVMRFIQYGNKKIIKKNKKKHI